MSTNHGIIQECSAYRNPGKDYLFIIFNIVRFSDCSSSSPAKQMDECCKLSRSLDFYKRQTSSILIRTHRFIPYKSLFDVITRYAYENDLFARAKQEIFFLIRHLFTCCYCKKRCYHFLWSSLHHASYSHISYENELRTSTHVYTMYIWIYGCLSTPRTLPLNQFMKIVLRLFYLFVKLFIFFSSLNLFYCIRLVPWSSTDENLMTLHLFILISCHISRCLFEFYCKRKKMEQNLAKNETCMNYFFAMRSSNKYILYARLYANGCSACQIHIHHICFAAA